MLNFKYHLVTICGIFLSLAVGLLLGAAIGGSGLLSSTTNDLVDSLSEDFVVLNDENDHLSSQLAQYSSLAGMFVDQWQAGRLAAKDVMVVTGAQPDQQASAREVAGYVAAAGGRCVIVRVNTVAFGTQDDKVRSDLQSFVPDQPGQDYQDVLAAALAAEWTRGDHAQTAFDGGAMSSEQDLAADDKATYPITSYLLANGIIAIENSSVIPDTINGYTDMLVHARDDEAEAQSGQADAAVVYEVDPMGARLGSAFASLGAPTLFTQELDRSALLMDEASARHVAGVSDYTGNRGRYSVIALLEKPARGIYGPDREPAFWYPAIS